MSGPIHPSPVPPWHRYIIAGGNVTRKFTGDIPEMVRWDHAATEDEILGIEIYLTTKYL